MNITIANRLYQYRKRSGLSQEEIAEKLGVSRQAVSKWERAESSPDTDNLINLAKLYGVSLDELINSDPIQGADSGSSDTAEADADNAEFVDTEASNNDEANGNSAKVHIGMGGIHVKDGGDEVHISLHDGIHVKDGDDEVHISLDDGIHIKDGENVFHVDGDTVENKSGKTSYKKHLLHDAPVALIVTVAYFALGLFWNLWHPGWIIFITIPVINSLILSIERRDFSHFAYPIFITAVYLLIGFVWGLWHPWWFLFITIPLYYSVASWISEK